MKKKQKDNGLEIVITDERLLGEDWERAALNAVENYLRYYAGRELDEPWERRDLLRRHLTVS